MPYNVQFQFLGLAETITHKKMDDYLKSFRVRFSIYQINNILLYPNLALATILIEEFIGSLYFVYIDQMNDTSVRKKLIYYNKQ
jgi:hypothetical protein